MNVHTPSVRDYLRIIFRRKWALLLPLLLGCVLIAPVWMGTAPRYRALAAVQRQDFSAFRGGPASLITSASPQIDVRALQAELFAWTNLEDVIIETKQDVGLETQADWQAKYAALQNAIQISAVAQGRGIDIIHFAVVDTDPQVAADLANTISRKYVEMAKSRQAMGGRSTIEFLQTEMERYKQKLSETEKELDQYHQEHFSDLPNVKNGIRSRLLSLRIEKASRELQLTEAQSRLKELKRQLESVPVTSRSEVMREQNPVIVDLSEQLMQRRRQVRLLTATMTEDHPQMKQLREEIATLEEQLAETPEWVEVSEREIINPQYQDLLTHQNQLEQETQGYQAALRSVDATIQANMQELQDVLDQENRYNELVRQRAEYTELYNQYRTQLNEAQRRAKVQQDEYVAKVEVYAPALKPEFPYRTPKYKLAAMCVLGGLAAGIGLMFALEFCDRSFRNIEDAKEFLQLPVLASISVITPAAQEAARRRRRLFLAGGAALLLLVVAGAATAWYFQDPGGFQGFMDTLKTKVNKMVG